jgi:hypothetical protein
MPEEPPFDPWDSDTATVAPAQPATTATASATDDAPRYEIHLASEALEPQPPIEWPVEGVFSAGSLNLLTGEPGDGKTSSMLDCMVSVGMGERWLGYAVKQGPVLLVDEESGPQRLKRRLGDVMRGHNAGPDIDLYFITLARFDLWDARDVGALQCAIEDTGARFVVIDALADIMPGRDENAVKDVQPVFMALRAIAETTGAAIVVIHHNNKSGGYRGSSAIKGAVDLLLTVDKAGDVLTFTADKARDVDRESVKFAARCNWGEGVFNLSPHAITQTGPTFNKSQEYVLRYLSEHGPSLLVDIQTHADTCSENGAKQAVYALSSKGLLARVDDGGPGERATYGLTEQGRAACPQPV